MDLYTIGFQIGQLKVRWQELDKAWQELPEDLKQSEGMRPLWKAICATRNQIEAMPGQPTKQW